MSVMRRMKEITTAAWYDATDKEDDPLRLADRYLQVLREQITYFTGLHRKMHAHAENMEKKHLYYKQLTEKRERQAELAILAEEEEAAKLALQEKLRNEEQSVRYLHLYRKSHSAVIELEEQLKKWNAEYREFMQKRQYYEARMQSVYYAQCMNRQMEKDTQPMGSALNRVEERIADMEREAEVWRELRGMEKQWKAKGGIRE